MTEIKDFIYSHPDTDDPNFIQNITKLKEFYDLRLESSELPPKLPGIPLKHQEMSARYFSPFTPYNRGLIWHDVGTGKACLISFIIENYKKNVDFNIKPALILVRNYALRDSLRNEIANRCTNNIYLARLTQLEKEKGMKEDELTDETKLRRLNANIATTYEIMTYGELLDRQNFPNDNVIRQKYSGRKIFVDEIHNIRMQSKDKEKSNHYNNLHHLLHIVKNTTQLLLSATPIWDKVYDIAGLFNLLLPLDKQFPMFNDFTKEYFDKNGILIPKKGKEFKKGYIVWFHM
jgi:hypothetical protein